MSQMSVLEDFFDLVTAEDISAIMPPGLKNGATLWARIGGPIGNDELREALKLRPPAKTHARSGFLCGIALLCAANDKLRFREQSEKMNSLVELFSPYLTDFANCVIGAGDRMEVEVKKSTKHYHIRVPVDLANREFIEWISAPWPSNNIVDGPIFKSNRMSIDEMYLNTGNDEEDHDDDSEQHVSRYDSAGDLIMATQKTKQKTTKKTTEVKKAGKSVSKKVVDTDVKKTRASQKKIDAEEKQLLSSVSPTVAAAQSTVTVSKKASAGVTDTTVTGIDNK